MLLVVDRGFPWAVVIVRRFEFFLQVTVDLSQFVTRIDKYLPEQFNTCFNSDTNPITLHRAGQTLNYQTIHNISSVPFTILENVAINDVLPVKAARRDAIACLLYTSDAADE